MSTKTYNDFLASIKLMFIDNMMIGIPLGATVKDTVSQAALFGVDLAEQGMPWHMSISIADKHELQNECMRVIVDAMFGSNGRDLASGIRTICDSGITFGFQLKKGN